MQIVWDEPKRLANLDKHGFDFAELSVEFFLEATIIPGKGSRFKAINAFAGRTTTVSFSPLGYEAISIISFRVAGATERKVRA